MVRIYNPYKRTYFDKVKEWMSKKKIAGFSAGFAIFWYLTMAGAIMPLSQSIDVICTQDVCESTEFTFLALKDVYIYPNESWLPENVVLKRTWGSSYRTIDLSKTWNKNVKYAVKFSMGNTYTIKYFVYGKKPWENVELKMFENCPSILGLGNKEDYFKKIDSHVSLGSAYTIYEICNPTDKKITEDEIDFRNTFPVGSKFVKSWKVERGVVEEKTKIIRNETGVVWVNETIVIPANKTDEEKIINLSRWEKIYKEVEVKYKEIRWTDELKDTEKGECYQIKISGELEILLGERNIEHVPELFGYEFREHDWWNISYGYRYEIESNATSSLIISANDTYGIGDNIYWVHNATGKIYVYCSVQNCSSGLVAFANGTTEVDWEKDSTRTGNNPEELWDKQGAVLALHMINQGGVFYDSTSQNNDGTDESGTVGNATGLYAFAGNFERDESEQIVVPNPSGFNNWTNGFTMTAWIRIETMLGSLYLYDKRNGVDESLVYISDAENDCFIFWATNTVGATAYASCVATTDLNAGTWYHAAFTKNSTHLNIYVDGAIVAQTALAGTLRSSDNALDIGSRYNNADGFDGLIDEMVFYNETKDAQWILDNYNNGKNSLTRLGSEEPYTLSYAYNLSLNGTQGDLYYELGSIANLTAWSNSSVNVCISLNLTGYTDINCSTESVEYMFETIARDDKINGSTSLNVTKNSTLELIGNRSYTNVTFQMAGYGYYGNQTKLSTGASEYDIIFDSNKHGVVYINVPRATVVNFATFNLTSLNGTIYNDTDIAETLINDTDWNVSFPASMTNDGNWSNYGTNNNAAIAVVYPQFDKPGNGIGGAFIEVKTGAFRSNFTVTQACWDGDSDSVDIEIAVGNDPSDYSYIFCNKAVGSDTLNESFVSNANKIYELKIYWTVAQAENVTVDTGLDGNFDYIDTTPFTNDVIDLNTTVINNYLNDCTDILCSVPFNITSNTAGILRLSNITINGSVIYPENITIDWDDDGTYDLHYPGIMQGDTFYINRTSAGLLEKNLTFVGPATQVMDFILPSNVTIVLSNITITAYNGSTVHQNRYDFNGATVSTSGKNAYTSLPGGEYTNSMYEDIWNSNNTRATAGQTNYNTVTTDFRLSIDEEEDEVDNITINWEGRAYCAAVAGANCGTINNYLKIYNFTSSDWETLHTFSDTGETDVLISKYKDGVIDDYIYNNEIRARVMHQQTGYSGYGVRTGYIMTDYMNISIQSDIVFPTNVSIDIDGDGTAEWSQTGELNDSNTPKTIDLNTTIVQNITDRFSERWGTLSMSVTSDRAGILEFSNVNIQYNLTENNFTSVNVTGTEGIININADAWGMLEISSIESNYYGDIDYMVSTNDSVNYTMSVRWSNLTRVKPYSWTDDLMWFAGSNSSKNVTPWSQTSTVSIYNFTFDRGHNASLFIKSPDIDSCMNLTISNSSTKGEGFIVNSSLQLLLANVTFGRGWLWADLGNCSGRWSSFNLTLEPSCEYCSWWY